MTSLKTKIQIYYNLLCVNHRQYLWAKIERNDMKHVENRRERDLQNLIT